MEGLVQSSVNQCVLISLSCAILARHTKFPLYLTMSKPFLSELLYLCHLINIHTPTMPPQDTLLFFFIFLKMWVVISLPCEDFIALGNQRISLFSQKRVLYLGAHNSGYISSMLTNLPMWQWLRPHFVFWILHSKYLNDWFIYWRWNLIFIISLSFSVLKLLILLDIL